MLDFSGSEIRVVRIGACYDVTKDYLEQFFQITLPENPGRASLPSGHLKVLEPVDSLQRLVTEV